MTYQAPIFNAYEVFRDDLPLITRDKIKELKTFVEGLEMVLEFELVEWEQLIKDTLRRSDRLERLDDFYHFYGTIATADTVERLARRKTELAKFTRIQNMLDGEKKYGIKSLNVELAKTTPIETVVQLQKARHTGNRILALCPIHKEKTGSFVVYKDSNTCHCFGCGYTNDVIGLVMDTKKFNFVEAVKYLGG